MPYLRSEKKRIFILSNCSGICSLSIVTCRVMNLSGATKKESMSKKAVIDNIQNIVSNIFVEVFMHTMLPQSMIKYRRDYYV